MNSTRIFDSEALRQHFLVKIKTTFHNTRFKSLIQTGAYNFSNVRLDLLLCQKID
ncbi:hypothetical protein RI543_001111 [Arxiozyma heterogenica]|uniref:Uncharacterized protein n=1 Tax=Arxiozyma heterogenica TaxID=278026 RepID=A0AAN8A944_9SACH|nr:hypothetical protein RI543_001111 [Kazachstania heterogenica]